MPPKIARLAALGAFSVCVGLAAVYALFVFITRPGASSGLDATQRFLCWFTVAGVLLALALLHVAIGRKLLLAAKQEPQQA